MADNCTDATADIARENGAICYERFDTEHRTKGYALQFLFERIRRDFGIIGRISMVIALFMKVVWKPIPHRYDATIDDMRQLPR